ncbi:MAG: hypothetical protein KJ065_23690 [Anaerolineae bacterium]|nr:hypothetical protein [Anaerolineae bacterium]
MRRFWRVWLTTIVFMLMVATAAHVHSQSDAAADESSEVMFVDFLPENFSNSSTIDNAWHPMQPGTFSAFEGITVEDGEEIPHRIEFTVTDLIKRIEGVNTVVAWIVDISDDEVVEKEIAFYAQDDDGNVWYFGEHPEEYENGEFVVAPTWIAGVEDALPGVKMLADPQLGTPSIMQGFAPAVDWTDRGRVDQVGQEVCVPVDCYEDVLVIAETSESEPDAYQLKYYARSVGNIRTSWRGADATQEELELVEYGVLDPDALEAIRAEALALEAHAYEISPDIYGLTEPSEAMALEG